MCFTKTVYNWGETALERFPELRDNIMSVVTHGSFEIVDLKWISECLGMQIRLTVDPSIYENVRDNSIPNLPRDCIFGPTSPQLVHLYYSWTQSVADPSHVFGHYDALHPCSDPDLRHHYLAGDVTELNLKAASRQAFVTYIIYIIHMIQTWVLPVLSYIIYIHNNIHINIYTYIYNFRGSFAVLVFFPNMFSRHVWGWCCECARRFAGQDIGCNGEYTGCMYT